MAGTIVSTPSLGASDWSSWITQQGLTDRGYMRLSLTNMSDTTASTIASGGVLEVAGSIYSFTDTAIALATGTASANVAVYFYVIPSAGGTTCTIEMNSTAPTWRDDYQGFYASAASTTRVVGGCYIGTGATYHAKFLYTANHVEDCLLRDSTRPLLVDIIEIGEWNMDADNYKTVDLPAYYTCRRRITVLIKPDDDSAIPHAVKNLETPEADFLSSSGSWSVGSAGTTLYMYRQNGGQFDGGNFNGTASTTANRGWIYIDYEA